MRRISSILGSVAASLAILMPAALGATPTLTGPDPQGTGQAQTPAPQAQTGTLKVNLNSGTGQKDTHVDVEVRDAEGKLVRSAKVFSSSETEFRDLPPGKYEVMVGGVKQVAEVVANRVTTASFDVSATSKTDASSRTVYKTVVSPAGVVIGAAAITAAVMLANRGDSSPSR
jgi:hypothetical protein